MDLTQLRKKIDKIDQQLVKALNERAKISLAIGKNKHATKKAIYAPDRERKVLERLAELNDGPMTDDGFQAIYREIMSSSIALEKPLRIAYLGAKGSYSYTAAYKKFGSQVSYVGMNSIADVFKVIEMGDCDYGMVPIENTVEGTVTQTADILTASTVKICAQLILPIVHNLLFKGSLDKIKKVYSHPQVLAQSRQWLLANLPPSQVGQIAVESTTHAAKIAAKEKGSAALGSMECSKIYKVPAIVKGVQDVAHNTTRFFIIGNQEVPRTGKDRTSIVFSIKDRSGALYAMLAPFAKNKINLTKIESRPIKQKAWDYYFFVDLEGHHDEKKVKQALDKLEGMCKSLKVLGSYPA